MSLRPASISQPNVPSVLDLHNVPAELQLVLGLLSLQAQRPYCDGYVLRKHVNLPGMPLTSAAPILHCQCFILCLEYADTFRR
jgi:hypothetical protein